MGHAKKKMGHILLKVSPSEKRVALGKLGHTCKNRSHYGSHFEKRVTLRKMCHILKNGSHFERWFTLRKISHTPKNSSHFTFTLEEIGHTSKNGSPLAKSVTLEKISPIS